MLAIRFACVLAAVAVEPASADPITIHERPGHVTEAVVDVDASPAEVYALVTDYAKWTTVLSDVASAKVERGGRRDARVRFKSRIFEHTVTVQFDNAPDQAIRFTGVDGPPGGRAGGTYVLQPLDGGKRTHVIASLYLDVVGIPSLVVRDSTIRQMRESKLRADMTDVMRVLTSHPHIE